MSFDRNVSCLSAPVLLQLRQALAEGFSHELDGEEAARFERFQESAAVLEDEISRAGAAEIELATIEERVDPSWLGLREILGAMARLADLHRVGVEARRLERKYFPEGGAFASLEGPSKLAHGKVLLAQLDTEALSPEVGAAVGWIVDSLRFDHRAFERVSSQAPDAVAAGVTLASARRKVAAKLGSFVSFVEVVSSQSTEASDVERAERILHEVDRALGRTKTRAPARGSDDDTFVPSARTR
jgi:hypothetical protein